MDGNLGLVPADKESCGPGSDHKDRARRVRLMGKILIRLGNDRSELIRTFSQDAMSDVIDSEGSWVEHFGEFNQNLFRGRSRYLKKETLVGQEFAIDSSLKTISGQIGGFKTL